MALSLARDELEPRLSRDAAEVLLIDLLETQRAYERVSLMAIEEQGILQQEAARALLVSFSARIDPELFPFLVQIVADTAKADELPPDVRGNAIDALVQHHEHPLVAPVVVSLLQPENWFFGATGQHFPVHSLARMIVPLADSNDPRVRQALQAVWLNLHLIDDDEDHEYVRWELENWVPRPEVQPGGEE